MLKKRLSRSFVHTSSHRRIPIFPIIFLVFILVFLIVAKKFLIVTSISCQLSGQTCPEQIKLFLDQFKGASIFWIDKKKVKSGLQSTGLGVNPVIELKGRQINVSLDKNTRVTPIQVFFTSLTPSFSFETSTSTVSSPWQELSNLLATQSGQLMLLNPAGILENGEVHSNSYLFAVQSPNKERMLLIRLWIDSLNNFEFNSPQIYFFNSFIVISQPSEMILVISYQQLPDEILKNWVQIRSLAMTKKVYVLDFRYNHPILR